MFDGLNGNIAPWTLYVVRNGEFVPLVAAVSS